MNKRFLFQSFDVIKFLHLTLEDVLKLLIECKGNVVVCLGHGAHSRLSIRLHAREQVRSNLRRVTSNKLILLLLDVADKLVKVLEFFFETLFVIQNH